MSTQYTVSRKYSQVSASVFSTEREERCERYWCKIWTGNETDRNPFMVGFLEVAITEC